MRFGRWARLAVSAAILVGGTPLSAAGAVSSRPSILVIVADDLGYSDLGAFGGEIDTPNLDALAKSGVRLTGFHTAPTCSPTRSMLLSGADNHEAGLGTMAEALTPLQQGHDGYEGYLNQRVVALPELLRDAGYQTLMVGKWHLGLEEDQSPAARGFQKSYALLQGLQNHFGANQDQAWDKVGERSTFRENGRLVAYPTGAYDADVYGDRMAAFIRETKPGQPLFAYLTFTQPHWPLQAPAETIAKYRGRYDAGPEALRRQRLERQKALGLIPADTQPHPVTAAPAWESLTPEQRALEARKMEVYAAMVDRLDQNVGKVIAALKATGRFDNTLIVFMSDNGPEGSVIEGPGGHTRGKPPLTPEDIAALKLDNSLTSLGSANSYVGYGPLWAQASSAPSRLFKGYTTEGGIRTTAFVTGPGVAGGRISNAFLHVKDVTPTVLDLTGVGHPDTYRGHKVFPLEGHSWAGLLRGTETEVRPAEEPVGWELFFRRAIRRGDWKAVFLPKSEGAYSREASAEGTWELFNLRADPAEAHDLAEAEPEKLKSLVADWDAYARATGVILPPGRKP
ncbi:MAG TPA: arylsulfatase [Phenylobacterium sp.]|nr:arylsulfatase [Phenylobacterium sp.]